MCTLDKPIPYVDGISSQDIEAKVTKYCSLLRFHILLTLVCVPSSFTDSRYDPLIGFVILSGVPEINFVMSVCNITNITPKVNSN